MTNIAISYDGGKNVIINQFNSKEEYDEWSIEMCIPDENWVELYYRGNDKIKAEQEAKRGGYWH